MIALKMLPLIAGEKDMKSDKSVLVIDTPKSCAVCPIFQNGLDGYCPVALSSPYNKYNERDKHCPLKPLPNKLPMKSKHMMWQHGWNECLDAITGKKE